MHLHEFVIFPTMHLRNGEVIRFTQGDLNNPTVYSSDPIACAQGWIAQGAKWMQVINLDAAFDEDASHHWPLIEKLCALDINVQYGGGMRNQNDIDWAIRVGINRVLISTAAVENPQLIADNISRYGSDAIALAIDTDQQGEVLTHGWKSAGGIQAVTLGIQMHHLGITTAVHTSINRDGSMTGIDLETSTDLARLTGLNVIVGGGIGSLEDVVECYNQHGISGVLIGKALHTQQVDLKKALHTAQQKIAFDSGLPKWKEEQKSYISQLRYELSMSHLEQHLHEKGKLHILDAGGGNGLDSVRLARQKHRLDLVDVSSTMLQDHRNLADAAGVTDRITAHPLDIRQIHKRFQPNQFDAILCHNVIQYLDDWEEMLLTTLNTLKPKGILSLVTLNQYALPYRAAFIDDDPDQALNLLDQYITPSHIFEADTTQFTHGYLSHWLEENDYTLLAYYGIGCMHHHPLAASASYDVTMVNKFHQLERALANRSPYKETARFLQLIAQKN